MSKKKNKKLNKKFNNNQGQASQVIAIEPVVPVDIIAKDAKQKNKIASLINTLAKSEHGKAVLEDAVKNKTKILTESKNGLSGCFDPNKNVVVLSPRSSEDNSICTLAHELRHASKAHTKAPVLVDHTLNVKSLVMSMRAMEADAYSYEALCTFELKECGIDGPWRETCPPSREAIESSFNEEGALNPQKAMIKGFEAWFKDDYLKKSYENMATSTTNGMVKLNNILLEDAELYSKNRSSSSILTNIANIDGKQYVDAQSNMLETSKHLEVSEYFHKSYSDFFDYREKQTGIKPDASLKQIPIKGKNKTAINQIIAMANSVQNARV
jgi:hypothetical protein